MRGLLAFLLTALLAVNLLTYWKLQQLQQQVAALEAHTKQAETTQTVTTALINRALPLLEQARAAVQRTDLQKARRLLAEASAQLDQAGQTVNAKTAPGLAWIRQQAQSLENQIHRR